VARTDDLTVFHFGPTQRLAVVRAAIFDGVELRSTAYDDHGRVVDFYGEGSRIA